jgi:hypothetical protein
LSRKEKRQKRIIAVESYEGVHDVGHRAAEGRSHLGVEDYQKGHHDHEHHNEPGSASRPGSLFGLLVHHLGKRVIAI